MTKQNLTALVEDLQPQVDQLAEVLLLELGEERDYVEMLLAAHRAMATISEDLAGRVHADAEDDLMHAQLLAETRELSQAMRDFLGHSTGQNRGSAEATKRVVGHAAHLPEDAAAQFSSADVAQVTRASPVVQALVAAATRCRERRDELSLLIVEPITVEDQRGTRGKSTARQVRLALVKACSTLAQENVSLAPLNEERTAAILSNCERRAAVAVAHNLIAAIGKQSSSWSARDASATAVFVGVATASVVPRNFDPMRMIERAERCLSAARACGISTVKSIEV